MYDVVYVQSRVKYSCVSSMCVLQLYVPRPTPLA